MRVCEKNASKKIIFAKFAAYQNLKICKTERKRRDSKSSCTESIFGRVSEQHSKTWKSFKIDHLNSTHFHCLTVRI